MSWSFLSLKTLDTRSGRSWGDCPGLRPAVISGHFGLQVMVKKMSGLWAEGPQGWAEGPPNPPEGLEFEGRVAPSNSSFI